MTEIQRCGTCKHWDQEEYRVGYRNVYSMYLHDEGDEAAEVRRVATNNLYGLCHGVPSLPEDPYDGPPIEPPLALTRDGSDYMATLSTRAEFGCVLWEQQSATEEPA